jgi:uncharacterized protein YlxW (UPF0749 family)
MLEELSFISAHCVTFFVCRFRRVKHNKMMRFGFLQVGSLAAQMTALQSQITDVAKKLESSAQCHLPDSNDRTQQEVEQLRRDIGILREKLAVADDGACRSAAQLAEAAKEIRMLRDENKTLTREYNEALNKVAKIEAIVKTPVAMSGAAGSSSATATGAHGHGMGYRDAMRN